VTVAFLASSAFFFASAAFASAAFFSSSAFLFSSSSFYGFIYSSLYTSSAELNPNAVNLEVKPSLPTYSVH
jgi:hypothetical protein